MERLVVLGGGRVGLPWALFLAEQGYDVVVYDINQATVDKINCKESPLIEPGVQQALECYDIQATTKLDAALSGSSAAFIYVPTPELRGGGLDGSIVATAFHEICDWAWRSQPRATVFPVIVCSTVMPGTMAELWKERTRAGPNGPDVVDLFYCPPLIALGSALNDHRTAAVQYFGARESGPAKAWVLGMYAKFWGRRIWVMSWMQAEVGKLLNNIKIAQRIRFAHDVSGVCDAVGVDPRPILSTIAADPRLGSAFLKAGPPFDGPCIKRDLRALKKWLGEQGAEFPFLTDFDWWDEELLAIIDLATEAHGDVLVVGSSYKALYYGDPAVFAFSDEIVEVLRRMGHTVRSIPAPRTLAEAPEFTENFTLICLMEQSAVAAKWVRGLCKREWHVVYDPWLQVT